MQLGMCGMQRGWCASWERSLTSPQASYTLSRSLTTSSSFETSVGTTRTFVSPTMAEISCLAVFSLNSSTSARAIFRPSLWRPSNGNAIRKRRIQWNGIDQDSTHTLRAPQQRHDRFHWQHRWLQRLHLREWLDETHWQLETLPRLGMKPCHQMAEGG